MCWSFIPGMYAAVEDHGETDARLADAVRRLQRPTTPVTGLQMIGIPSVQICAAAMDYHADVIVMGTHGRTGLEHIFLGSTAERVLTMAPCPVLTAREPNGSEGQHKDADQIRACHRPDRFFRLLGGCPGVWNSDSQGLWRLFDAPACLGAGVLRRRFYAATGAEEGRPDKRIDSQLRAFVSAIQSAGVSVREVDSWRCAGRFDS